MAQSAALPARKLPPSPRSPFPLGNTLSFVRDWEGFLTRCQRECGDIAFFRFLGTRVCLVSHPDFIEYVLVRNPSNFLKSRDYVALQSVLGNGLLTSEGPAWREERQRIQPAFSHENIAAYAKIMTAVSLARLETWRDAQTRDIHAEMVGLTLDIVTRSLFGAVVSTNASAVGQAIRVVMEQFSAQAILSFVLPERFPLPKGRKLRRSLQELNGVIYGIIRERRAQENPAGDLLQTLLAAQDERGARMSDQQLRDEIMTLFLAGHETTANALTWTWYLLAQNPEAEKKLGDELGSVLGGQSPTAADLSRLPYTLMVIKESLRLYPPAWGIGRRAIEDFELNGYFVPAGTNVFLLQWITQRDPRFFAEPERFEPERWRDDPVRAGRIPRFAYFPFGGGPRVCVGAGFAMMEATLLLATMAQRFRLSLAPGPPVEPLFTVTLRPKRAVPMVLHRR
jgi:cytochrome P450